MTLHKRQVHRERKKNNSFVCLFPSSFSSAVAAAAVASATAVFFCYLQQYDLYY